MIYETLVDIKNASPMEGLIFPYYDGLSIVNIANSVKKNFGIQHSVPLKKEIDELFNNRRIIVFLLIDAMGYNLISRLMKTMQLKGFNTISDRGLYTVLTSVFPSTTAVALPSISTGLTPAEHGLLGYRFYSKKYGYLINSLFGKPANVEHCKLHIDIDWYLPHKTLGELLKTASVKSYVVTRLDYMHSHFEKALYRGFQEVPYLTMSDMFSHISDILKTEKDPAYINAYWWAIDALSHRYGPNSVPVEKEIVLLDNMIQSLINEMPPDSLLIVSADHGQIYSPPEKVVFLQQYDEIAKRLILPVSDLRAPYLYIRGSLSRAALSDIDGVSILSNEDAFRMNLFGQCNTYRDRVGDFVLLIKDDKSYAYLSPEEEISLFGKHGGLSEDEMLVPLFLYAT